jgi:hypothetical protein
MAVDAHLHPGGQRIEVALPTHRAALTHCQLLVATLDARGTCIGSGTQAARPWTVPACGLPPLRPRRSPRRRLRPRRACAVGISCEHSRGVWPIALCLAGSGRCLRALAKKQGPQPLRTEFGFLQGEHHIKIHADHPLHPLRVSSWQIAAIHPGNQGLTVFASQRQVVRGLLHHASFATETPQGHATREAMRQV